MKPELISFDAAGTLIDVRWKPGAFAVDVALDGGLEIDAQPAREAYERLLQTRWQEYCEINRSQDEGACDEFWKQLTRDWLAKLGQDANQADALAKIAYDRLYGADQVLFTLFPDVLPVLEALSLDEH